jgi:predicted acyl esterase
MPEGHTLAVHRFPSVVGRAPVVVLFTPYRKESWWLTTHVPATHAGFEVIVADVRAIGGSTGSYTGPFSAEEVDDAVSLLAWALDQDFCDGNLALIGSSYSGLIQYHIAALRPPGLRCIAPSIAPLDYYRDMTHRGGIPSSMAWAASTYGNSNNAETAHAGLQMAIDDALDPFDSPQAHARSAHALLDRIQVPVLCLGGLYDFFTASTVAAHTALDVPSRLVLGDWGHETEMSDVEREELSRWLDYWLWRVGDDLTRGNDRVVLHRSGDRSWQSIASWPKPDECEWLSWQPFGERVLVPVHPLLDAVPPPTSQTNTDPALDHFSDSGMRVWGESQVWRREPAELVTDVLGPVLLVIDLMSDEVDDVDVHARLSLIRAGGVVEQLTEGRVRASHRVWDPHRSIVREDGQVIVPWRTHAAQDATPIRPDEQVRLEIALSPVHLRLEQGETVQLGLTVVRADGGSAPAVAHLLPESYVLFPLHETGLA